MNMWRARAGNRLSFNDLYILLFPVFVKNLYKSVNIFYNGHLCRETTTAVLQFRAE